MQSREYLDAKPIQTGDAEVVNFLSFDIPLANPLPSYSKKSSSRQSIPTLT